MPKPEDPVDPDEDALPRKASRSAKLSAHRYTRLIHVYTSMVSLLIVLFFAMSGLTLNHPTWTLGGSGSRNTISGILPTAWKSGDTIDWFVVSEHLRNHDDVHGSVSDHRADATQGSIAFNGPGYAANALIDVTKGTYQLTVDRQGLLAVMNDLHKGRDTKRSWKWLIDVSAILLITISLTGLGLQFFLRKRRRSSFSSVAVGIAVVLAMTYLTTR